MGQPVGFLRRHGFVVAAVALPVLVVGLFALARGVPMWLVEDPRYDLVYSAVTDYSGTPSPRQCQITAVDGRVRVRWSLAEQPVYGPTQRVYRLDPASGDVRELPVPEPTDLETPGATQDFFLEGLEDVRIDGSPRAPDGYEYEFSYPGSQGLFGGLFGSNARGPRAVIRKQGRWIALPRMHQGPYGYDAVTFLGWAVPLADR